MERQILDQQENARKTQIIESLLQKPGKKPDFAAFKGSDVLKRVQQFMPMFIQTTDRLLSDPELLKQNQMDIRLEENGDSQQMSRQIEMERQNNGMNNNQDEDDHMNEDEEEQITDPKIINMDIGIGVYDINNQNFDEKTFKPSSTRPIVRFNGLQEPDNDSDSSDEDEDDSGSDDSNLYYEFNSDNESNNDNASSVTKDTIMSSIIANKQQQQQQQMQMGLKRPLIVDITPKDQEKEEEKKPSSNSKKQQKNKLKRQRRN